MVCLILLAAGLYLSFSKYGKVVLGDPKEKPSFTMFEYASILIAMGIGSTIMRTGMVQWTQVAIDPPLGCSQNLPRRYCGEIHIVCLFGVFKFLRSS